jgi:Fe2+ or Zn2+ uptake regulation protein
MQRIVIMDFLKNNRTHPTADEVYEALRRRIPMLSKATVYNTLKVFIEHGVACHAGGDEENVRFGSMMKPLAHFHCKKCGKITDMEIDLNQFLPEDFNAEISDLSFYLKGTCEKCKHP